MCEYVYYFFIALNVSKSLEKLLRALLQEANLGSDVLFVVSILQLTVRVMVKSPHCLCLHEHTSNSRDKWELSCSILAAYGPFAAS